MVLLLPLKLGGMLWKLLLLVRGFLYSSELTQDFTLPSLSNKDHAAPEERHEIGGQCLT